MVASAVRLSAGTATRIVVNDRLDVAIAAGAAGVHLRADSIPGAPARAIAPVGFAIGRTVHSVEEAVAAEPECDYLVAGTVWPSASKPGERRLLGSGGLAAIVAAVRVPVLAIGGVSLDQVPIVASTGAAGVAAIDLFLGPGGSEDTRCRAVPLQRVVREARQLFDMVRRPS
jgi:thiamine-phosphate diphosphorylase